jgi:hypothetical protein
MKNFMSTTATTLVPVDKKPEMIASWLATLTMWHKVAPKFCDDQSTYNKYLFLKTEFRGERVVVVSAFCM